MMRLQLVSCASTGHAISLEDAKTVLHKFGGYNVRKAQRDMGTWYGSNLPAVAAFTLIDFDLHIVDAIEREYKVLTGHRCVIETRRTRTKPKNY
jgi:hypothetical protein